MARLIPSMKPGDIENRGERIMAQALVEQLPDRVEVFHSFAWQHKDERGRPVEGECDFVLVDPEHGMLGIEVKGGQIEYDPEAGLWQRVIEHGVRQQINKNPFDQVNKSMHRIKGMLQKVFSAELPFTYSFAMAFPEGRFSGTLPANITPEQILDCDKCTDIKASLDRLFASQKRWSHPPLDPRRMEMIRSTLMPHYQVIPVLWRQIEKQEEQLRRLSADQGFLLDMLAKHRKAAIRGVAGSGKTLLALSKAQELARSGQRTLFLCSIACSRSGSKRRFPMPLATSWWSIPTTV